MDDKKIVEYIIKKRKQKKITQEQLAESMNVTQVTVCSIEKGEAEMDINECLLAARALGISEEELFDAGRNEAGNGKRMDKTVVRLICLVVVLVVVNLCVLVVGDWYHKFRVENYMLCTVIEYGDMELKVKVRNPVNEERNAATICFKIDDRLKEQCSNLKSGDIVTIHYFIEPSDKRINSSYSIATIELHDSLKWNQ